MGIKQKDRKEGMRRGIINLEGEVTKKRNNLRGSDKKRTSPAGESQKRQK